MSKAQFAQRRDGRVAALQYLFAWSLNSPTNLAQDLTTFFADLEQPRESTRPSTSRNSSPTPTPSASSTASSTA